MSRMIAKLFRFCLTLWNNTTAILSTFGSLYASRFWLLAYILIGMLLLIAGIPMTAGIVGQFYPPQEMLVSYYGGLAEKENRQMSAEAAVNSKQGSTKQDKASDESALLQGQETTPFGILLYRRVLQIGAESQQARYALAIAISDGKKTPHARQLMQAIAPDEGGGYPQAHAWLAVDMLGRLQNLTENEQAALLKHLEEADTWDDCNPNLRSAYAELLAARGEVGKAIPVLERAAKQDPKLRVMLTAMAKQAGLEEKAAEVSDATEKDLEERVSAETPNLDDIVQFASLMLVKGETERCRELVEKGLRLDPGNASLHRLASNSLLIDFRKSVSEKDDGLKLNLDLLDAALKADPTNPELSVDLARAVNLGVKLSPEMNEQLETYLASGRATSLLHLMFANQKLIKGDIAGSIPNLEIADRLAPKSPVIMNNLALALALTDRSQLDRAFGLITEAIKIAGEQIDLIDTQGQINLIAQRPVEAIACFEKVLSVNPNAIETRKMLVEAYKAAGMASLAQKQQELIESLKKGDGK